MRRKIFDEVHDDFRAIVRAFFEPESVPDTEKSERDGKVSCEAWEAGGGRGPIGWALPEEYGAIGVYDFRFNQFVAEEMFATVGELNRGFYHMMSHLPTGGVGLARAALPFVRKELNFIKSYVLERWNDIDHEEPDGPPDGVVTGVDER